MPRLCYVCREKNPSFKFPENEDILEQWVIEDQVSPLDASGYKPGVQIIPFRNSLGNLLSGTYLNSIVREVSIEAEEIDKDVDDQEDYDQKAADTEDYSNIVEAMDNVKQGNSVNGHVDNSETLIAANQ